RCVFDAGARAALQGQRDDQMLLLDCLVRGENHGVMGGEDGLAVGVVWDTLLDPISNGTGLRVCPRDHARTSRSPAIAPSAMLSQPVRRPR
ncbi:MAG: hypothetical protein O2816_07445, partial [Planctomycetota bacterium]|nr:hypothetical protein [Planctomycetota bacterium]